MTLHAAVTPSTVRLHEECAEELGRLDALVSVAPPAAALVLQSVAVAGLAVRDTANRDIAVDTAQATRLACASLVASRVEMVHAAAMDRALERWQQLVDDGERRARSGAPLAIPPDVSMTPDAQAAALEALRPGSEPRPLLWRALHIVAWMPETPSADLLSALVLTAGGLTDRLRLLPFAAVERTLRLDAAAAWRAGDITPLARVALASLAANARHLRLQLKLLWESQAAEDAHVASIGRAGLTARDALAVLRLSLATSVPDLSVRLSLSRPAAGAALQRLVELGLAEEITGRARDRVFVYAGAWGLV